MFGLRKRELEKAAKRVAAELAEKATREDQRRRGVPDDSVLTSEDYAAAFAIWTTTAGAVWQQAKRGDTDALRQTARNYLFGTGMPVKPRKACLWLDVARILEQFEQTLAELPPVDPFWDDLAFALARILTPKERAKANRDAMDWVKVHRALKR